MRVATGNSLLEPMRVNHFSPRYKLFTEDDGEPQNRGKLIPPVPIRVFSVERCTAGNVPGEGSVPVPAAELRTLHRVQEQSKRVLGWRRTREDPFEGEWEQILSWLLANPERSSGDIFRELQRRSPGCYQQLQIRTLQRGMRNIRAHLLETREEQW